MQYYLQLNNPGSGNLSVHRYSAGADDLSIGKLIRVNYRGQERGGWFIENISYDEVKSGEHAGEWKNVTGRGAMAVLADGMVYPAIGSPDTTRTFTNVTMASMLLTFIAEAKARGCFPDLRTDFSAVLDSNSEPWTDLSTLSFNVDSNLLDVINQLVDLGLEFDFKLDWIVGDYVLYAYQTSIGSDVSASVVFRPGLNCAEVNNKQESGELKNALRVTYNGGATEITDAASIAAYRRREAPFQVGNVTTSGGAVQMATPELTAKKDPQLSISIKVEDAAGNPRAFVDYKVGDWVGYDAGDGAVPALYRVRGMMLNFDENDKYAVITVDLNSIRLERELLTAIALRKLGSGVIGSNTSSPMAEGVSEAISAHNMDNTSHATRTLSGGDLAGTIGIPTVAKLRGRAIKNPLTLVDKNLLKWSDANQQFEPGFVDWDEIENKPSITWETGEIPIDGFYLASVMRLPDGTLTDLVLLGSLDGVHWTALSNSSFYHPASTHCQEPSIIYHGGFYWVCYTQNPNDSSETETTFGVIKSADLKNWTAVASVDMSSISSVHHVWAPEFFIDPADDSVHVFVTCNAEVSTVNNFKIYEVHPTDTGMTTWSTPVEVTGDFPSSVIDVFVHKIDSTYYLWYKNNGTEFVCFATSTSLTSGYVTQKSGDWAGWGSAIEGPCVVELPDGRWRIYLQKYVMSPYSATIYYSESTSAAIEGTWSTKARIVDPWAVMHGTMLRSYDLATFQRMIVIMQSGDLTTALSDLSDVSVGSQTDGEALVWSDAASKWVPGAAGAGAVTNSPGGVEVSRATNQAVANATDVAVSFTTEVKDDANYFDAGAPTRITIPETGWYHFHGSVDWSNGAAETRFLQYRINGTIWLPAQSGSTTGIGERMVLGTLHYFNKDDYLELMVIQWCGSSLNIEGATLSAVYLMTRSRGVEEAPVDGTPYVRQDADWVSAPSGGALSNHDHSGDAGDGGTFDAANLTSGAATDGQVLTADGAGGAAWENPAAGGVVDAADVTYTPAVATDWNSDTDPGNVDDALDQLAARVDDVELSTARAYVLIQDQKSQNTSGGSFTSGDWRTRTLNTEVSDTANLASLSSNQITLAAGTYEYRITAPGYACDRHQARLYNTTDASVIGVGSSAFGLAASLVATRSEIVGKFTIAASKALEVQHRCQTTSNTYGFGVEANLTTEVYTIAEFWKVG